MAEEKYYVVWEGLQPGVYSTWAECQAQVKGVKGAMYKSFKGITRTRAEEIFRQEKPDSFYASPTSGKNAKTTKKAKSTIEETTALRSQMGIHPDAIAVDASSQGNPGLMEYRGVVVETGDEVFHSQVYPQGTNNLGEFLAIVHAMAWMEQQKYYVPIYSDSRTALAWVSKRTPKTTLTPNSTNALLFEHLRRAVVWLNTHDLSRYTLLKWPTEVLGEIPADFGRK